MRLSNTGESERFCAKPRPGIVAALIYGEDETRVAALRERLLAAWLGPEAMAEMRLTRLAGAELRGDPAALDEALRAQGFFGGARGVTVTGATDGLAETLAAALRDATAPDAVLVATAGTLKKGSALRKLFEGFERAVAAPVYPEAPGPELLRRMLAEAGAPEPAPEALQALLAASAEMDHGALARLVEKIALWKAGEPDPVTAEDVLACAPPLAEAGLDRAMDALAEGDAAALRAALSHLRSEGANAVTIVLAAERRFRQLHEVAARAERGGVESAIAALRPPLFGPLRERLSRQARRWPRSAAEAALAALTELDAGLRGGSPAPAEALLERELVRIALRANR